ncbi:MAG: hypothetical protein UR12_C0013G0025 [candidate division TM6 bacterium GW2011_GWF2_30_66]|jgi:hypothetical protein|nr:MAG: hypothetical protein UR12_C0013G0025 [candidate division TM6 bacterium GW2011_GWF2_30_66]
MKRATFISIFICTHLLFIFFQINKNNKFISLSYTKQKYENEIKSLTQKKQELSQNLYNLRKSSTIKKFASEKLDMYGLNIKQVKKIDLVKENIEQVEKLTSQKQEESTSLTTLRCGPKGPTQGERGGESIVFTPIQKESTLKNNKKIQKKLTIANNKIQAKQ